MKSYDFKHKGVVVRMTPQGKGVMLIWRDGQGERQRIYRSTKKKAEEKAKEVCESISSGRAAAPKLTPDELADCAAALIRIHPRSLLPVLDEFLAAESILGGVSLIEAARFYASQKKTVVRRTIAEVVTEFLEAKRQDKVSAVYLSALKSHLTQFQQHFTGSPSTLSAADLDSWLRSMAPAPRTRKNYRNSLATFFTFCSLRQYLPAGWNELDRIAAPKCVSAAPVCYAPDQYEKLLRAAQGARNAPIIVYLVLCGMCGLRHAEALRVEAGQIRDGHVVVEAKQAKVRGRRRLSPLHGTAAAWLTKYAPKRGRLVLAQKGGAWTTMLTEFWKDAEVEKLDNGLRDSFISYRMAQTKNANEVSDEAGNSPAKVHANYRQITLPDGRIITEAIAVKWFSISV